MNHSRLITALCAAVLPFALACSAQGCGKNDEDATPPTPSAAPTPTPTPSAAPPMQLKVEEDAGVDAADDAADAADAAKVTGGGGDPTGIKKCCAALRSNANSAPLDQKGSLLSAAALCDGLVNSPQGKQALVSVRGMLKGAGVPASCQ